MKNLKSIIAYLKFLEIPTHIIYKIIFLIEWKYVLVNNKLLFEDLIWYKNSYGFQIKDHDLIKIIETSEAKNEINSNFKYYIGFILEKYNRLTYNHFASLYISIYPYIFSKENIDIDLLKCKRDYKKMLKGIKNEK